jgi:sodium-dependent dicarboxylate transporter 2/3/5
MLLYIRFNIREFSISKEALLEIIQSNKAQLGKIKNEEKIVGFIFLLTVLYGFCRRFLHYLVLKTSANF